jgi:predicted ester cyclase
MSESVNKANARRILEKAFPANDQSLLAGLVSDRFVNHEAPPGTPPGRGGITMFMDLLSRAFSDQAWDIDHVVEEGDMVVVHCTHSGRHTGDYFGLPASGNRFSYRQMHLLRLEDGQAVEHWAVRDDAGLLRQLTGALEPARA